jgi:hypothetical protein
MGVGLLVALALGSVIRHRFGIGMAGAGIAVSCGAIAVGLAERKGKVKSIEEINRPMTLFPPAPASPTDRETSRE